MMLMGIGPPAMILSTTLEVAGADEKDQINVAKVLTVSEFFQSLLRSAAHDGLPHVQVLL